MNTATAPMARCRRSQRGPCTDGAGIVSRAKKVAPIPRGRKPGTLARPARLAHKEREMSDLEKLLDLLRPARKQKAAIEILNKKVRPKLARMNAAQLSEALAQAAFTIYCLEAETES